LLNGYCDKEINNNCRLVINFLNLPILIEYLTNHKLASVKTKSFEKWLEIYNIRKNNDLLLNTEFCNLIKAKASLINSLRKATKL
jgi:hypothetical protein